MTSYGIDYHRMCFVTGSEWMTTRGMRDRRDVFIPKGTKLTVYKSPARVSIYVKDEDGDQYHVEYDHIRSRVECVRRNNTPIYFNSAKRPTFVDSEEKFFQVLGSCLKTFQPTNAHRVWLYDPFEEEIIGDAFPDWWYNQIATISLQASQDPNIGWASVVRHLIQPKTPKWHSLVLGPRTDTLKWWGDLPDTVDGKGRAQAIWRKEGWGWRAETHIYGWLFEREHDALKLALQQGELYRLQEPVEYKRHFW